MSSDDAYLSFLEKANSDLSAGQQSTQTQRTETQTVHANAEIPASLQSIDAFYISETDEPFEPVVLEFEGAGSGEWPGSSQLSSLIAPDDDLSHNITTLSASSFDPRNQYPSVFKAVRAAASGPDEDVEVKVYRVEVGSSRVEYFVLGLDTEKGRVVGLKARAVET
ncbi:hypothetical protein SI65_06502 [Aspergillus cristatus]|uniref:Uncharacterized protein n=1 Tax=Aspergillus cristatus TaxID=573508 RepID=A0A1E3B9W6_ASPCR|nr:hypothetical protein SI65_06502 [Aspergillus cristatus]